MGDNEPQKATSDDKQNIRFILFIRLNCLTVLATEVSRVNGVLPSNSETIGDCLRVVLCWAQTIEISWEEETSRQLRIDDNRRWTRTHSYSLLLIEMAY